MKSRKISKRVHEESRSPRKLLAKPSVHPTLTRNKEFGVYKIGEV
jgi:hypothetical protein